MSPNVFTCGASQQVNKLSFSIRESSSKICTRRSQMYAKEVNLVQFLTYIKKFLRGRLFLDIKCTSAVTHLELLSEL